MARTSPVILRPRRMSFSGRGRGKAVDDALVFLDHFGKEAGPFTCPWFVVGFVYTYNTCINNVDIVIYTAILTE